MATIPLDDINYADLKQIARHYRARIIRDKNGGIVTDNVIDAIVREVGTNEVPISEVDRYLTSPKSIRNRDAILGREDRGSQRSTQSLYGRFSGDGQVPRTSQAARASQATRASPVSRGSQRSTQSLYGRFSDEGQVQRACLLYTSDAADE